MVTESKLYIKTDPKNIQEYYSVILRQKDEQFEFDFKRISSIWGEVRRIVSPPDFLWIDNAQKFDMTDVDTYRMNGLTVKVERAVNGAYFDGLGILGVEVEIISEMDKKSRRRADRLAEIIVENAPSMAIRIGRKLPSNRVEDYWM
ncbi:hypothetical protein HYU07_03665 [Candidatus Woesearchaeota archaeon]|nr:hypothetical protein [Candidatus Woesearchaeota archaeon]